MENIVIKGEIACYKQFLIFSQYFPQLYILSVSKCGIECNGSNIKEKGEYAAINIFSLLPHNVFYPFKDRNNKFSNNVFVVCKTCLLF